MERDYANKQDEGSVIYFVGKEIEKTKRYGDLTLFVVGPRPFNEIVYFHKKAEEKTGKKIKHIFASANMSLQFWQYSDIETIKKLVKKFHVTIDGEANDILRLLPHLPKSKKLTIMVSVKIPYVEQLKKHDCVIKIDDVDFRSTNPGVWCHRIDALTGNKGFTSWDKYKDDVVIATDVDVMASQAW